MAIVMALGVDGIITDYPGRLRAVMEAKGWRFRCRPAALIRHLPGPHRFG